MISVGTPNIPGAENLLQLSFSSSSWRVEEKQVSTTWKPPAPPALLLNCLPYCSSCPPAALLPLLPLLLPYCPSCSSCPPELPSILPYSFPPSCLSPPANLESDICNKPLSRLDCPSFKGSSTSSENLVSSVSHIWVSCSAAR